MSDSISPPERLGIVKELRRNGMFAGVALAPIIPYISDSYEDLEDIFKQVKKHGGEYLLPSVLTIHGKEHYEKLKDFDSLNYPRIFHRFEGLYENNSMPAGTYCGRINDMLDELSEKYAMPVFIPRVNSPVDSANICCDIFL